MKIWRIFLMSAVGISLLAQEATLAPRASRLRGTADTPSVTGEYVVTFPSPNECVKLGPIRAGSRSEALYILVSKGGFTLSPATGGLTVWTIEEWTESENLFKNEPCYKEQQKRCAEKRK